LDLCDFRFENLTINLDAAGVVLHSSMAVAPTDSKFAAALAVE